MRTASVLLLAAVSGVSIPALTWAEKSPKTAATAPAALTPATEKSLTPAEQQELDRRAERLALLKPASGYILKLPVTGSTVATAAGTPGHQAFEAMTRGNWNAAIGAYKQVRDPLVRKMLIWYRLSSRTSGASFAQISRFMKRNPHWPLRVRLRYRAEYAMAWAARDADVVAFFKDSPPKTATGAMRLAQAYRRLGREADAKHLIRTTFEFKRMRGQEAVRFRDAFGSELTKEHYAARLHHALYHGRMRTARRYLARDKKRFDKGERALFRARMLLRRRATPARVASALAAVPPELRDHRGLVFDQIRWHRRAGRIDQAVALLNTVPSDATPHKAWWRERAWVIRVAIRLGRYKAAYNVARNHGQTDRRLAYEGEWLAGWTALRWLRQPQLARPHFAKLNALAGWPVSKARGAYWLGRTAEAMRQRKAAIHWYVKASRYPSTFYGQFALARLGHRTLRLRKQPAVSPADRSAFARNELVRATHKAHALGQQHLVRWFAFAAYRSAETPGQRVLAGQLAVEVQNLPAAVRIGKLADRDGAFLVNSGYPIIEVPAEIGPEASLILALIRQESEFNHEARSWVGARGLMQLMPRTARSTAKKFGAPYKLAALTTEPDYNMKIGTSHLVELLHEFNGNYVLVLAAYNAGRGAARFWMRVNGDPRGLNGDRMIDWIESIPVDETRNYVQRVLEAWQVYRARFGQPKLGVVSVATSWRADLKQSAFLRTLNASTILECEKAQADKAARKRSGC